MNCILCDIKVSDNNESEEHFLPQAIGGRDSSKKVICNRCNSCNEVKLDTPTTARYQFIATWLNVKRERGKHPNIRIPAKNFLNYLLLPGGEIQLESAQQEGPGGSTCIFFNSEEEFIKHKKKIDKKNRERNKRMVILGEGELGFSDLQFPPFSIGNDITFRTVTKAAFLFYVDVINPSSLPQETIRFINGEDNPNIVGPYYGDPDVLPGARSNCIYHAIIVRGEKAKGVLYGFVELFGTFRYKILLDSHYSGDDLLIKSIYDVISWKDIDWSPNICLSIENFEGLGTQDNVMAINKYLPVAFENLYSILLPKLRII